MPHRKLAKVKPQFKAALQSSGVLEIPLPRVSQAKPAWIVDGQQRAIALSKSKHRGFPIPVGDFGTADPEYPAFSPNVLAVGGTSLYVNNDGSYNRETQWGYYSDAAGQFIGSGGGQST